MSDFTPAPMTGFTFMNTSTTFTPPPEKIEVLKRLLVAAFDSEKLFSVMKILAAYPGIVTHSIRMPDEDTDSPITLVAVEKHMECLLPFMIKNGVDINERIFHTKTLLEYAALKSDPSLVAHALMYGGNPELAMSNSEVEDDSKKELKLLDAVTYSICQLKFTKAGASAALEEFEKLSGIVTMLLESGAKVKDTTENGAIASLIKMQWDNGQYQIDGKLGSILTDLFKRHGDPDMRINGIPATLFAAGRKNISAILCLAHAGANIQPDFLGKDLIEACLKNGLGDHTPAITNILLRTAMDAKLKTTPAPAKDTTPSEAPSAPAESRRRVTIL